MQKQMLMLIYYGVMVIIGIFLTVQQWNQDAGGWAIAIGVATLVPFTLFIGELRAYTQHKNER
ncbi:hypothetical protein [Salsuginibacillus kocurii]|uniref:hypothetical protein n=1 Tax=Salsuginibacillus kocurii TaxID=427078 RepID=UPI000365D71C|nr:hypothetical protein [Salsuginibacillus kocurii]